MKIKGKDFERVGAIRDDRRRTKETSRRYSSRISETQKEER